MSTIVHNQPHPGAWLLNLLRGFAILSALAGLGLVAVAALLIANKR